MEKQILVKDDIGAFFSKMYEANRNRDLGITLNTIEGIIQIYNKEKITFTDIKIVDEPPTVDTLIQSLN